MFYRMHAERIVTMMWTEIRYSVLWNEIQKLYNVMWNEIKTVWIKIQKLTRLNFNRTPPFALVGADRADIQELCFVDFVIIVTNMWIVIRYNVLWSVWNEIQKMWIEI